MFLKSLELHGFKSFADKTLLDFDEGVTGIVGPNGCGKSNIVDAMRWVLGETSAKALRGGEMADVIFNGTDRRSPLGMAEVTLTLSGCEGVLDTEYDEVSLGRRVFRDGKGEYLINKQICRLKDIQNLLMDTGIGRTSYSIMEQGKIDMLLSSKPEDRRAVFEEAAGITKYKSQKKEAIRKLDYTEANLVRVRDVVAENERQIKSLSRQARKAKRYQQLHDEVKTLDLHLSHKQWREYRAEKSELTTSINALKIEQDHIEDRIDTRQAQMASARYEYSEIENQISDLQAQVASLQSEIRSANNRIEFNGEMAHEQTLLIKKAKDEINDAEGKKETLGVDIERVDREIHEVASRIAEQEATVNEDETATQEARQSRELLNQQTRELEEERSQLKSRFAALEATIETQEEESEATRQRLAKLDDEILRLRQEREKRNADADSIQEKIQAHQTAIEEFEENLARSEQQYFQAKKASSDMQEGLTALFSLHSEKKSRLEVLRQLVEEGEGFEKGTQAVLKDLNQPDAFGTAIERPLSSWIEVETKYALAIETALGKQLQTVLVRDTETAEQVVNALKKDKLGKASILATEALEEVGKGKKPKSSGRAPLGAIDWAITFVDCQKAEVETLLTQLLDGVLVAPDLNSALRLQKRSGDYDIVTLGGEFVSNQGIIYGGANAEEADSVLKRQSEIRVLSKVTESLHVEVDTRRLRKEELMERVDQFESLLGQARDRLERKRLSSSKAEGTLGVIEKDISQLSSKLESQEWEKSELLERETGIEEKLNRHRQERDLSQRRIEELDAKVEELSQQLNDTREKERELIDQVTESRTNLAVEKGTLRNLEEQRSPMRERWDELIALVAKRNDEIVEFAERIETGEKESAELQTNITAWSEESEARNFELETIQAKRAGYSEKIESGESELTDLRKEAQEAGKKRGKEEVKVAEINLLIKNVEASCRERYQVDLDLFKPDSHLLLSVIETQKDNASRKNSKAPKPKEWNENEAFAGVNEIGGENGGHEQSTPDGENVEGVDFSTLDPGEPDWEFVEETVDFLRNRLDSMGPVNLDAIPEYDELEEHYRFHLQQLEDLENAREKLLRMISKINRKTRILFSETFEKIRSNFRDMFKELFGEKAKADLILLDDDDPLECGIDIIAKPPGKKLQSVSLLSGGERSLTAVALLFAIYMVKPSPFCVLDELDAPLDETNITRFIRVLDRFIGDSQFVIVTHSKRTMSRADVMYGVSMQEFGVSKTVGVQFSDSSEKNEESKMAGIGG